MLNMFSFNVGKAHYGQTFTPLLLNGLIKTVSLAADDSMKAAISLIKMLKALHFPAESHDHYRFVQHFCCLCCRCLIFILSFLLVLGECIIPALVYASVSFITQFSMTSWK